MRTCTLSVIVSISIWSGVICAEQPAELAPRAIAQSDQPPAKTIVYAARNSPSDSLSAAVAGFLEGTNSRVVSDANSNTLLIQTAAENQQRVFALLEQLDRKPRTLRIELQLLKAHGVALTDDEAGVLSGCADQVRAQIASLVASGRVSTAQRIELAVVENQLAFLQVSGDVPLLAGTTVSPRGGAANSYRNVSVGMMFKIQARLAGDNEIVMDVDYEHSSIEPAGAEASEEAGPPNQGVSRLTFQTNARIQDGDSSLAGTVASSASTSMAEAYVVLSASVHQTKSARRVAVKLEPKAASNQEEPPSSSSDGIDRRYLLYFERLLAKYDQNNDQMLDANERSQMSKDYSAADADNDGLVTADELARWSMKR